MSGTTNYQQAVAMLAQGDESANAYALLAVADAIEQLSLTIEQRSKS